MRTSALVIVLGALSIPSALAAKNAGLDAKPVGTDGRIRQVAYNPHTVVTVRAAFLFSTAIEFAPEETIDLERISIGDAATWQVAGSGNVLFIKPQAACAGSVCTEPTSATNMVVLTDRRSYAFNIVPFHAVGPNDARLVYRMRFRYPEDEAEAAKVASLQRAAAVKAQAVATQERTATCPTVANGAPPAGWNLRYSFKGSKAAAPLQMLDDGKFTCVRLGSFENTPAVFVVDGKRKESLINFRREGEWMVIERIARQYTFRANNNTDVACVFNDGYPERPASSLAERNE